VNETTAPTIEDVSSIKKKMSFDIPWEEVKRELDAAYQKVGKTAKIKGFRPGKVPRAMLEKFYAAEVQGEVAYSLVNRHYWDAVQKNAVTAVSQPQIEQEGIEAGKNFVFTATVEVEPQVDPVGYRGLDLEKLVPIVSDEEVEERLQQMRKMFSVLQNAEDDRGVRTGDFVTIDFEGSVDGEKKPEMKSENHLLEIGSGSFIAGFESQLVEARKGETRHIEVVFPEDYHAADLTGKKAEFVVNVKDIKTSVLPELDDAFLEKLGGRYASIDAFRADIRKRYEEEKKQRLHSDFIRQINDKLLALNSFDVPEFFVEQQIYSMVENAHNRMISEGMDHKKAEELAPSLVSHFRDEAVKIVKSTILIDKIAHKESIFATDEELESRIREFARQRSQDYEAFRKSLDKDGLAENIRGELVSRKTYEFIEANANVTLREEGVVESGDAAR
jgi:trigger factor